MDAFWDLTDMRQVGLGSIGPIGWLPCMEYAEANKFDETQTEDLIYYVRVLDHEYLNYRKREIERGNK